MTERIKTTKKIKQQLGIEVCRSERNSSVVSVTMKRYRTERPEKTTTTTIHTKDERKMYIEILLSKYIFIG